jgi:hypothetical protein
MVGSRREELNRQDARGLELNRQDARIAKEEREKIKRGGGQK